MSNLTRSTAIAIPAVQPYAATLTAPAATEPDPAIAAFDRFRSALAALGAVEHDDAAAPANAEYRVAALALAGTVATTPAGLRSSSGPRSISSLSAGAAMQPASIRRITNFSTGMTGAIGRSIGR